VRLFTDTISPTPDTYWLALNQPIGSWYTAKPVTYGEVYESPDGSMSVTCESLQFSYTGSDPPETIRGYYVVDPGTPDKPIHGNNLPAPVTMGTTLDSVIVMPSITIPPVRATA
jgi:hypothetical protein